MLTVKAPVATFNGKVGADTFIDGTCTNPTETQLDYYRTAGYEVLDHSDEDSGEKPTRPGEGAKKKELVDYATHLGLDVTGMTIPEINAALDQAEDTAD